MSILAYIRSLAPSFKKNAILESVELTSHTLRETTIPAVNAAATFFNEHPLASKEAQAIVQVLGKRIEARAEGGAVSTVAAILENALVVLAYIGKESKHLYSETEANMALTYVKATYLRIIECAEFASAYAQAWVNWLLILETGAIDAQVKVQGSLAPVEIKWLEENYANFLIALSVLGKSVKEIEAGVKGIPDAAITEMTETTFPSTQGAAKTDPFGMRHLSAAVNPFYLFGMMRADSQAKAFKAKKAEAELLELRLLNLQRLHDKQPDAKLQKEIDHMASRVSGLKYEIAQKAKEYLE